MTENATSFDDFLKGLPNDHFISVLHSMEREFARRQPTLGLPRVMICVPSQGLWRAQMGQCHSQIAAMSALYRVLHGFNDEANCRVHAARNSIVRRAMAADATHILWMDSDMTAPDNSLLRLLSHDKDIVGAGYKMRSAPYTMLGRLKPPEKHSGLGEAKWLPGGFMLVKMSVYSKVPSPWYRETYDEALKSEDHPDGDIGEDINFCHYATNAGFHIWCDLDLSDQMGHVGDVVITCKPAPADQMGHIGELNVSCQNPAQQKAA